MVRGVFIFNYFGVLEHWSAGVRVPFRITPTLQYSKIVGSQDITQPCVYHLKCYNTEIIIIYLV